MPLAARRGPHVPQSRQGPSPEARSPPRPSLPLGRGVLYGLTGRGGHLSLSGWGTRPPARRAGTEHPAHGGRAGGRGQGACPSRGERPVSPSSSAHSRCEQTHVCETFGAGPQAHTRAHTHTRCLVLGAWPQSPALSGPRRCPGAPGESLQGLVLSRAPPAPRKADAIISPPSRTARRHPHTSVAAWRTVGAPERLAVTSAPSEGASGLSPGSCRSPRRCEAAPDEATFSDTAVRAFCSRLALVPEPSVPLSSCPSVPCTERTPRERLGATQTPGGGSRPASPAVCAEGPLVTNQNPRQTCLFKRTRSHVSSAHAKPVMLLAAALTSPWGRTAKPRVVYLRTTFTCQSGRSEPGRTSPGE